MKKSIRVLFVLVLSSFIFLSSCSNYISSDVSSLELDLSPLELPDMIPSNQSVNIAYGGGMCEAEGFIYYIAVSGESDKNRVIARVKPDGTEKSIVSSEYSNIRNLAADSDCLYFVSTNFASSITEESEECIYALPLSGGKEKVLCKVKGCHVFRVQAYAGRVYWEESKGPYVPGRGDNQYRIVSIKGDGTDVKILTETSKPFFNFLVCDNGIYYSKETTKGSTWGGAKDNIFYMDLNGKNATKKTRGPVGHIDELFWDQDTIYFLAHSAGFEQHFYDSFFRLNKNGSSSVLLEEVGYYPQDYAINAFCGISAGVVYHFDFDQDDETFHTMNLFSYDIASKKTMLITTEDMVNPPKLQLKSIQGKLIEDGRADGMYILGNDVFFQPWELP